MTARFTPERRERFLALIETGRTISDACAAVGISRNSVNNWVKEGREDDAPADKAEFARRFDFIRNGPQGTHLTKQDLVSLLEAKARSGNVNAMRLLLERPWEKQQKPKEEPKKAPVLSLADKLAERRKA